MPAIIYYLTLPPTRGNRWSIFLYLTLMRQNKTYPPCGKHAKTVPETVPKSSDSVTGSALSEF